MQSITISDVRVPSFVYAGSTFETSFFVTEQNASGTAYTLLNFNDSDYICTNILAEGGKIFWGNGDLDSLGGPSLGEPVGIYTADFNPKTSDVPHNIRFITFNSGVPADTAFQILGISVDPMNSIIYVYLSLSFYPPQATLPTTFNTLLFGPMNINNQSDTISMQQISNFDKSVSGPIFWDTSSHKMYWANNADGSGTSTVIYAATVIEEDQDTMVSDQHQVIFIGQDTSTQITFDVAGMFVDSTNDNIYYSAIKQSSNITSNYIFVSSLSDPAPRQILLFSDSSGQMIAGLSLNMISGVIYWAVSAGAGTSQFWKGTVNNLSYPTAILNPVLIQQNGWSGLQNLSGPCMVFYPFFPQTVSLHAPIVGSDYSLIITTYDSDSPALSDTEQAIVHVTQLKLSDALTPNHVKTGDPYTISWSSQIINQQQNSDLPVFTVLRSEGLSSNHHGNGLIHDLAPLIASDYPITITLCVSDVCVSDMLILQVYAASDSIPVVVDVPTLTSYFPGIVLIFLLFYSCVCLFLIFMAMEEMG